MKLDDLTRSEPVQTQRQSAVVPPHSPAYRDAPPHRGKWWVWPILLLVVGGLSYVVYARIRLALSQTVAAGRTGPRSFPVVAGVARRGDMPIYLNGLGTVTAFETVTVHSRVDGQLMKVYFNEGQLVHTGDLLAEIDPRPFQAQLSQAEGQIAKDQAQVQNAQLDLQRFLSIPQSITQQQVNAQKAMVAQLQGSVKSDQAQIDTASLQLVYCRITSPLNGRVGLRLVDEGNIIHATDPSGLVVITQLQPIAVYFYLREDDISEILKRFGAGEHLAVEALDHDAKTTIATGSLLASDNQVDPATGTLRFKAVFPNDDGALFPNQFVNARLLLTTLKNVVIVPAAAVQRGPQDSVFIYVVQHKGPATKPAAAVATAPPATRPTTQPREEPVELRNVVVGHQEGDEVVIESGISPGDIVVTDGVDKLQAGTNVTYRIRQPAILVASTQPGSRGGATSRPANTNRPGGRSGRRGQE